VAIPIQAVLDGYTNTGSVTIPIGVLMHILDDSKISTCQIHSILRFEKRIITLN